MRLSAGLWIARTYSEGLMSTFYRFLARFSGRRRGGHMRVGTMHSSLLPVVSLLALHFFTPLVEGCSSRSTPKPRPPAVLSTARPNVTFHTYPCTAEHTAYYCLNGGTCFAIKIGDTLIPACDCADGYIGERCDYKDLDGTYLSSRRRVMMLETASIASGATIAVFLVVVICMFLYVRVQRKNKENLTTPAEEREDLERRAASNREGLSYPVHHTVSTERGVTGDNISLAVYNVRVNTEPP
uniref:EGF-like domain-containing protein n=1 Tax=Riptortus pedestris TaxID=329032 RepID=R4WQY7_RIPPE|nr:conserved hypothetical protein [Riptortus pedestris]